MEIKNSQFVISAPTVEKCPKDNMPEYAFIGRSNVGKSSLINMLCNHKGLAKTSATPARLFLSICFLSIVNGILWISLDMVMPSVLNRCKTSCSV